MQTVAYLANQLPAPVEPYVTEEIEELRRRGIRVIAGSVRQVHDESQESDVTEILHVRPLRFSRFIPAVILALRHAARLAPLVSHALFRGNESINRRLKALWHTGLGVYYAVLLHGREVKHIHAHHGYAASWIAMVAARLLDTTYSLTLHGSDLLIDAPFLDIKLRECTSCFTVSEYNRRYMLRNLPSIDASKVIVARLGVEVPASLEKTAKPNARRALEILAVGRLHPVKNHSFLIEACARLRQTGVDFRCTIAGEGPERPRLERLLQEKKLEGVIHLAGHLNHKLLDSSYCSCDVVVLTSRSEGIPLVLMEAMARGKIIVAPAITGMPELVIPGKTGYLYAPGLLEDLVKRLAFIQRSATDENIRAKLDWIRHAAHLQVLHNFNRETNLARFADLFLQTIAQPDSLAPTLALGLKKRPPSRAGIEAPPLAGVESA